ncbi:MAG TPA: FAD-dependent monooxygenase [Candidatus Limnocylindrales bacterium]|nr:FAD-dependent monooxygenase [Candidatus Limnocylindrales bacterium]
MARDLEVPVLIVGGGGAGLTASMLLSQLGVETWLASSLPTTSSLPKAHVLNQRAMEIMGDVGLAEEIYERGTPPANMKATAFYAGFAGPGADHGRMLMKMDCWGAGYTDIDWMAASPRRQSNLPQIRLEPILKRRAEELAPGRVHFHHEVTSLVQDERGATATILDRNAGSEYRVRAQYVLACDAGRTIGPMCGVEFEGARGIQNEVSIHLSADLSKWARDDDVLIRWIWVPERGALAVLVPMGPDHWGPESEEWVFHINYATDDPRALDDAKVIADMREALGIGDHPVDVHKVSRWSMEGVVASSFQVGRVFMVGDAAHRHPPTGGLGLTSGMHDAHNLCWKLAAVLRGHAGPRLLESYEAERKPVDARNVQRSLENAYNHMVIGEKLGLMASASAEENWARLRRLWSGRPEDAAHRRAVRNAIASQSMEFREHVVEYGYTYDSTAVVPDGTAARAALDDVRLYEPSTCPGHPLPHAWIEDDEGRRLSTLDLVRPGRFLLIAGEEGAEWCEAGEALGDAHGLPLDVVRIGHLDGDLLDVCCHWLRRREIAAGGAVLVRPDRFVAWRSLGAANDALAELRAAFAGVLDRTLDHAIAPRAYSELVTEMRHAG